MLSMYFSMPAMPYVVHIGEAEHGAAASAVRIDALVLGQEADAGDAEAVHLGLLARRDLALDPDEALFVPSLLRRSVASRSGSTAVEQLDRLVLRR